MSEARLIPAVNGGEAGGRARRRCEPHTVMGKCASNHGLPRETCPASSSEATACSNDVVESVALHHGKGGEDAWSEHGALDKVVGQVGCELPVR